VTAWLGRSAGLAFGALARSWRFEIQGAKHLEAANRGPLVYALWHRQLLPLLWWHRHRHITLLISRHRDGEVVAGAAAGLGYGAVRGSSSRGGAEAFRQLLTALAAGHAVAVTPDGPRGPAGKVKRGVVRAARLAGAPILPVCAFVNRAWQLGSWDRMIVPRPFARVCIRYGPPRVPIESEDAECASLARSLDRLGTPSEPGSA
jgi:lysophospholipid acyltransferase (LPLAT)-like uncharacterized protein